MAAAARPLALLTSCAAGFAPEELVKRESGPPRRPGGRNQGLRPARARGNRAGSGSLQPRPSGGLVFPSGSQFSLRVAAIPSRSKFSPQGRCHPLTVPILPSGSQFSLQGRCRPLTVPVFPSGFSFSPQDLSSPLRFLLFPSRS